MSHWTAAIRDNTNDISARLIGTADALADTIAADMEPATGPSTERDEAFIVLTRTLRANAVLVGEDSSFLTALAEAQKMVRVARAIRRGEDPEQFI